MNDDITGLYCCIDDFCKVYEVWERYHLIETDRKRLRSNRLTLSEQLLIVILFHLSPCKNFKCFYEAYLPYRHQYDFKETLSYSRFLQLMPRLFTPLSILMHNMLGEKTGLYIADSTHLSVCHQKRISSHRVFRLLAKRSKNNMGWFYGFKLHMIVNHQGEIVAIKLTAGNKDDRCLLDSLTTGLKGKLFADKGYIDKKRFDQLYQRGLKLITSVKRNMKNYLMPIAEKLLLRRRFIIETIFDSLKNHMHLQHTRHRSQINFCINLLSCLLAYQFKKKKPGIQQPNLFLIQS